jgi:hypothetical protein
MFVSNTVNTEGALIKPFRKKRNKVILKKDAFSHAFWKKTSASSVSSTKKLIH